MSDLPAKADEGNNNNNNGNGKPSKRRHDGQPKTDTHADPTPAAEAASSPMQAAFAYFRSELEEHHDRRERVIKASRDITAQSKKIIFTLQRHRSLGQPLPAPLLADITPRKLTIRTLLDSLTPDLTGSLNQARYARQFTPGLQELIEAAVFEEYLTKQRLLTLSEARESLLPESLRPALTESDYLLGVYDATGEVMRFGITGIATSGAVPVGRLPSGTEAGGGGSGSVGKENPPNAESDETCTGEPGVVARLEAVPLQAPARTKAGRSVLTDLRELRAALDGLDLRAAPPGLARECDKKAEVMRASVEKVEAAVYGLTVRGSERPPGWVPESRPEQREEIEGY